MKQFYNLKSICLAFLLVGGLLSAQYADGIIVSNEGNFMSPNADVSFIDYETLEVTNDIYNTVNGEQLGDVLQHIGFYGDKAYLVINNSGKVVIADRETFKKEAVITEGINLPRYITFANDKAYVTNSGSMSVTIYNTSDYSLVKEIPVNKTVEKIETIGNNIFVQNAAFGGGKYVTVINATTDEIVKTIELEGGIRSITTDGTNLYVISSTGDFTHIYTIDAKSFKITNTFKSTKIVKGGNISISDDLVFFTADDSIIYVMAKNFMDEPVEVAKVTYNPYFTFYGFNVIGKYLFSADASGFIAPSEVKVYDVESLDEIKTIKTTIGANGFYNNNIASLGVNDVAENNLEVKVYPNPVVDYLQLSGIETADVKVFNLYGQLVKSFNYEGKAVNVSDLEAGLYIFMIETNHNSITKKVLVK
ncbi:MAG: DUF5074 domain-containing protein [Weeksellaceae bacterium]